MRGRERRRRRIRPCAATSARPRAEVKPASGEDGIKGGYWAASGKGVRGRLCKRAWLPTATDAGGKQARHRYKKARALRCAVCAAVQGRQLAAHSYRQASGQEQQWETSLRPLEDGYTKVRSTGRAMQPANTSSSTQCWSKAVGERVSCCPWLPGRQEDSSQ